MCPDVPTKSINMLILYDNQSHYGGTSEHFLLKQYANQNHVKSK